MLSLSVISLSSVKPLILSDIEIRSCNLYLKINFVKICMIPIVPRLIAMCNIGAYLKCNAEFIQSRAAYLRQ